MRSTFPLSSSSFIFRFAVLKLIFNRSLISVAVILLYQIKYNIIYSVILRFYSINILTVHFSVYPRMIFAKQ